MRDTVLGDAERLDLIEVSSNDLALGVIKAVVGYPLGECCFSGDGSVLAVAYPSGAVLWDPTTLISLGHVKFPEASQPTHLPELSFVLGSDFLVGCVPAASLLVVWNLQSLSIQWAASLHAECLAVDSTSQRFTVSLNSQERGEVSVAVFDPAESIPCAVYSKFAHPIAHLHFAHSGTPLFTAGRRMENGIKHTHAPLMVLSATHQYSVETETGSLSRKGEDESTGIEEAPSPFEMAFGSGSHGENDAMEVDSTPEDDAIRLDLSNWLKISSHALPPVAVLCSNLLDQIVDKNARTVLMMSPPCLDRERAREDRRLELHYPKRLTWRNWSLRAGGYIKQLRIKNAATEAIRLTTTPLLAASPFSVERVEGRRLCPGMTMTLDVSFKPAERVAVTDSIILETDSGGRFEVELHAPLPESDLRMETEVDFGLAPVKETSERSLCVANTGNESATVKWDVCSPFEIVSAEAEIEAGACREFLVRFVPREANPYRVIARLYCGQTQHEIKLSGTAKYPFLRLDTESIDFGDVPSGQKAIRKVKLTNSGSVVANYKISSASKGSGHFSVTTNRNRLAPGETTELVVTYHPLHHCDRVVETFQVCTAAGSSGQLTVEGCSRPNAVAISESVVDFGEVPVGESRQKLLQLTNKSRGPVHFQCQGGGSIFRCQPIRGVIGKDDQVSLRMFFSPASSVRQEGLFKILIDNGCVVEVLLHGSTLNCEASDPGKTVSDKRAVEVKDDDQVEQVVDRELTADVECINFGASSKTKETVYRSFSLTNRSTIEHTVDLHIVAEHQSKQPATLFKVHPEEKQIPAGESATFQIGFRPTEDGLYSSAHCHIHCKDLRPRSLPPLKLIGNSYLYQTENPRPRVEILPTTFSFPPACVEEETDTTILIKNNEPEDVCFEIQPEEEFPGLEIGSAIGVIPAGSFQHVWQNDDRTFETVVFLNCVLNNNRSRPKQLLAGVIVDRPRIDLSLSSLDLPGSIGASQSLKTKTLRFRDTTLKRRSKREIRVVNPSGVRVSYSWAVPQDATVFEIDRSSGVLAAGESHSLNWSFIPTSVQSYSHRAMCAVSGLNGQIYQEESLTLEGEGVPFALQLSPSIVDLGVQPIEKPGFDFVEIFNPSLDTLQYILHFRIHEPDGRTSDSKTDKNKPLRFCFGEELDDQSVQKAGSMHPRSRLRVPCLLVPDDPGEYMIEVFVENEEGIRSDSMVVLKCLAQCPSILISDVFSSGIGRSRVQKMMQTQSINEKLRESLTESDRRHSHVASPTV